VSEGIKPGAADRLARLVIIGSSGAAFETWLDDYVRHRLVADGCRTELGWVRVQRRLDREGRPGGTCLRIVGDYESDSGQLTMNIPLVEFYDGIALGENRCQFRVASTNIFPSLCTAAMTEVLDAMASTWPESSPVVEDPRGGRAARAVASKASSGVPKEGSKHRQRWEATCRVARDQAERNESLEKMCGWLRAVHPKLACEPETLAKICRAGRKGKLGLTRTGKLTETP
jgi:hypothetical protein